MILKYLLGYRTIHLSAFEAQSCRDLLQEQGKFCDFPCPDHGFKHMICCAHKSEDEAYFESKYGYRSTPRGENPAKYVEHFEDHHQRCANTPDNILDVSILRVSRSLYEKAMHLLYTTTTFSFEDAFAFRRFTESLSPTLKGMVTNLHFNVTMSKVHRLHQVSWAGSIPNRLVDSMKNLTSLTICFHPHPTGREKDWFRSANPEIPAALDACLDGFCRFQRQPLKQIRVMFSDKDDVQMHGVGVSERIAAYSLVKRRAVAISYELRLKHGDIAMSEIVKEQKQIQAAERKVRAERKAEVERVVSAAAAPTAGEVVCGERRDYGRH